LSPTSGTRGGHEIRLKKIRVKVPALPPLLFVAERILVTRRFLRRRVAAAQAFFLRKAGALLCHISEESKRSVTSFVIT
jgi:hypothetical protein